MLKSLDRIGLNQFLWFSKDTHSSALRYDLYQELDSTNLQPKE